MESIKSAWRNVFRQPSRSILTIMSIAIGVFSVLLIGTISNLGREAVSQELESLGMNGITVSAGTGSTFSEDALELAEASAGVAEATPLSYCYTDVLVRGSETKGLVWGVDSNITGIISLNLLYGRSISREDVRTGSRVCLVEQNFVRQLYQRDNATGKTLKIMLDGREEEFTIIGVVEAGGGILQSLMGESVPLFLYLPYTTLGEYSGSEGFERIAIRLTEDADPERVGTVLEHTLNNEQGEPVKVENLNQ